MANVVTVDRTGFDRLHREWVQTLPVAERDEHGASIIGTSRDLRPMFLGVPDAFVAFLQAKGFVFDLQG